MSRNLPHLNSDSQHFKVSLFRFQICDSSTLIPRKLKYFSDHQITDVPINPIYPTPTGCGSSTFASLKNFAASSGGVGLM